MLETFCQIPERKDHSGETTAGFSVPETLHNLVEPAPVDLSSPATG